MEEYTLFLYHSHILKLNFDWIPENLFLPWPIKSSLTYVTFFVCVHYKIEPYEIMFLNYQLIKVNHPGIWLNLISLGMIW